MLADDCHDGYSGLSASLISLVVVILMTILSSQEHRRTVQPSDVLTLSLLVSAACDCLLATTFQNTNLDTNNNRDVSWSFLYLVQAGTKLLLFLLELWPKTSLILPHWAGDVAIEESSGIINKTLFWWINGLIAHGYRNEIAVSKTYSLDHELRSQHAFAKLYLTWSRYKASTQTHPFLRAVVRFATPSVVKCILPRLLFSFFKLIRPFFIREVILYVQEGRSPSDSGSFRIVGMAVIVYVGYAASLSPFQPLNSVFVTNLSLPSLLSRSLIDSFTGSPPSSGALFPLWSFTKALISALPKKDLVLSLCCLQMCRESRPRWRTSTPFGLDLSNSSSACTCCSVKLASGAAWDRLL